MKFSKNQHNLTRLNNSSERCSVQILLMVLGILRDQDAASWKHCPNRTCPMVVFWQTFFLPFLHSYWWKWRESETGASACAYSNTHIYSCANAPVHSVHTISDGIPSSCMYLNPHMWTLLCVSDIPSISRVFVCFLSGFDGRYLCHWLCQPPRNLQSLVHLKSASLHKVQWRTKMWKRARAGPCPVEVYGIT